MKKKLFLVGVLACALTFGLMFVGCEEDKGESCAAKNGCNNNSGSDYCGKSGCDAYYWENCDC